MSQMEIVVECEDDDVDDEEFERRLSALGNAIDELVDLLDDVGETHWRDWFTEGRSQVDRDDARAFDLISSAFGGMGSFNDLVIHPINGHVIAAEHVDEVNARLAELRGIVGREARELGRATR